LKTAKDIWAPYHALLSQILNEGESRKDRTGTGTLSIFAPASLRFDLAHSFPAYTGRQIALNWALAEGLWFLKGCPDLWLKERAITIWDEWADPDGKLGRIYGYQWRSWRGLGYEKPTDQIADLLKTLTANPYDRRTVVTAWQPAEMHLMALPPCHYGFNVYISQPNTPNARLNLCVLIRSSDVVIGLPSNIANYAFITHALARHLGIAAGELVVSITGDAHIYNNLNAAARELLQRADLPPVSESLPQLQFNTNNTVFDAYDWQKDKKDFSVINYFPHPKMELQIAV